MTYSYKDTPLRVYGLPAFEKDKRLRRLPEEVIEAVPSLKFLGLRCPGARLCFRTNSREITVRIVFETLSFDIGMSIYSCQSAFVFAGERSNSRYLGLIHPTGYDNKDFSATLNKGNNDMEDITVWLPRNEIISDIEISVADGAEVCEPTPYKHATPVVFYGSSITEGGCCCNMSSAYNAILSRWLDTDYINLGFSGNAKGEMPMADFISDIEMSVFVYDYDHNAPNPEHLEKTHEPFFLRFREKQPNTPVIMMTRPQIRYNSDEIRRREIVRKTFENAVNRGDKNVYFIDGETFYGDTDRDLCTIDGIHPNDLGFSRMASVIEPTLKKLLEK